MTAEAKLAAATVVADRVEWAEFLATVPPGTTSKIRGLCQLPGAPTKRLLAAPALHLHCASPVCMGIRVFKSTAGAVPVVHSKTNNVFLSYTCRNCGESSRTFALVVIPGAIGTDGDATKLGEWPPFGPHTPPRLLSILGPDAELFLQGRRAEVRGLGMGAFAYYRRVVEHQKDRLLTEIVKAARKLNVNVDAIRDLEAAALETRFSESLKMASDALPTSLFMLDQNPLLLLHRSLSRGLHELPDAECLALATGIRVVLTGLADRMTQVLKDHNELKAAMSELMSRSPTAPHETDR
jgi:hypothetical protein